MSESQWRVRASFKHERGVIEVETTVTADHLVAAHDRAVALFKKLITVHFDVVSVSLMSDF